MQLMNGLCMEEEKRMVCEVEGDVWSRCMTK